MHACYPSRIRLRRRDCRCTPTIDQLVLIGPQKNYEQPDSGNTKNKFRLSGRWSPRRQAQAPNGGRWRRSEQPPWPACLHALAVRLLLRGQSALNQNRQRRMRPVGQIAGRRPPWRCAVELGPAAALSSRGRPCQKRSSKWGCPAPSSHKVVLRSDIGASAEGGTPTEAGARRSPPIPAARGRIPRQWAHTPNPTMCWPPAISSLPNLPRRQPAMNPSLGSPNRHPGRQDQGKGCGCPAFPPKRSDSGQQVSRPCSPDATVEC
jgi:hypothetical protein